MRADHVGPRAGRAEGMRHDRHVHGIGQAMTRRSPTAPDGQPLTASFMDYALPRASDFPLFELCATGIATVDDVGAVTGVSGGEAQISATFENRTGSGTITVQARPPVQQWRGLTIAAENRLLLHAWPVPERFIELAGASSGCLRERAKSYVQHAEPSDSQATFSGRTLAVQ